jgi:hypothetical protein
MEQLCGVDHCIKTLLFDNFNYSSSETPSDFTVRILSAFVVSTFHSHIPSTLSNEVVAEPTEPEKQIVKFLLDHLIDNKYWKEKIEA